MKAKVERITLPKRRRILAVSDIHGDIAYLKGLLQKTGFCADDILVIVGDMLEKGPQSLQTLRFIMELSKAGNVFPILGNCDEWHRAVEKDNAWSEKYVHSYVINSGFRYPGLLNQMCREIGFEIGADMDVVRMKAALREAFVPEFEFLRSLPHVLETENYTFVHGGLPEGGPENWTAWKCMKNDDFMGQGRSFDKWMIVGHWPVVLYGADKICANPIIASDRKIISIDGGCVLMDDGQLNALVIPEDRSEEFSYICYDPFPVRRVKTAQEGATKSAYIRWGDNLVSILEPGEEFSLCRHLRTGYEMEILTKYLYEDRGAVKCNDSTDYILPLAAGDEVSVIEETSRATLVKHKGTTGWYFGDFE